MSELPADEPLPFFEEREVQSPTEEAVLRCLASTLSVGKTLKRFPSLKPKDLQEILSRFAQQAEERGAAAPPESPPERKGPEFLIFADGASRGNPGEAGAGAVIADARGRTIKELKSFLGVTTNNVAEYRALILALEKALDLGAGSVNVYLDSELVVRQLRGEYRVREPHLKPLHEKALALLRRFARTTIQSVPRQENRRADQLANEAIDQKVTNLTD